VKAERPSRTAHFVAHGRALADAGFTHVPDFHDPTARVFLDEKGKQSLAKSQQASRAGKQNASLRMAHVMADMIALRTAAVRRATSVRMSPNYRQRKERFTLCRSTSSASRSTRRSTAPGMIARCRRVGFGKV
jgi:hypothetical protein